MASPSESRPVPPTPTVDTPTPKSARPTLPALVTPKSATFPLLSEKSASPRSANSETLPSATSADLPSELARSPLPGRVGAIKQEEDVRTPTTPPTAYTDFLKALSPAVSTPSTSRSPMFDRFSGKSTPLTQPSSAASCPCNTHDSLRASCSAPTIPPSPFMRPPNSARTPTSLRRLRIPQSPIWSPATDSPKSSAHRSPFSPADWSVDGKRCCMASPASATHKPVSVRHVVTRTVTYTRTPLDPAPKGKKRRLE